MICVGDTVRIRGDLRMSYVGGGEWKCAYFPEQLIDGKYVRHLNYNRPWTDVVDDIHGDMARFVGGGGRWNVRLLEKVPDHLNNEELPK